MFNLIDDYVLSFSTPEVPKKIYYRMQYCDKCYFTSSIHSACRFSSRVRAIDMQDEIQRLYGYDTKIERYD